MILFLLVIGIGGRNLLSWLQTDDFPIRLVNWRQRSRWQLDMLLGMSLLGLVVGSLWLATGSDLLNDTPTGLTIAVGLMLLGLAGWFWPGTRWGRATSPIQVWLLYLLLGFVWFGLLLLWIVALRALGQPSPPPLGGGIRLAWVGLTVALVVAFVGLTPRSPSEHPGAAVLFQPYQLKATAWALLLLAGALAVAVLVRVSLGRPFLPLINDDAALVETLNGLERDVQTALFSLREEQALRLSYDPAPLAQSTTAYLDRVQANDARTATYFAALQAQEALLAQTQDAALVSLHDMMTDSALAGSADTVAALVETLQLTASPADGLAFPLLQTQTAALTQYFANHPTRAGNQLFLTQAEVSLANANLEMSALAQRWEQMSRSAAENCLIGQGVSPDSPLGDIQPNLIDCTRRLVAVWGAAYQPGLPQNDFVAHLNQQQQNTDDALAAVSQQLTILKEQPAPGLWQQLNLLLWMTLQNKGNSPSLMAPGPTLDAGLDPGNLAANLGLLNDQRQEQRRALLALHQFAKQQRSGDLYPNLFALGLLTVALAGIGGFLLFAGLSYMAQLPQPKLTSQKQIERIVAMGLHVVVSVLVWRAFARRNPLYFVAGVGYHALLDSTVVYLVALSLPGWQMELVLAMVAVPGVVWLWWSRDKAQLALPHPVTAVRQEWHSFFIDRYNIFEYAIAIGIKRGAASAKGFGDGGGGVGE